MSKIDRSEVQIDSKEGYLTLWCHQPYPSQSLKPKTVVELEGQEVESGWTFFFFYQARLVKTTKCSCVTRDELCRTVITLAIITRQEMFRTTNALCVTGGELCRTVITPASIT